MSNWPNKATRHSKAATFAEAIRRGLFSTDAGETWLYMFHDIYGVAHFRHVDHRGYMQMLPDSETASDRPVNDTPANDISANEHAADNPKHSEKRSSQRADRRADQQSGKTRQKSENAHQANDNANNSDQNGETKP